MSDLEESTQPRWQWLDWWFTPRWRALLTWVVLAVLWGGAVDRNSGSLVQEMVDSVLGQLRPIFSTRLLDPMREVAFLGNIFLGLFWIEPLALRLALLRGVAWLGVRVAPFALVFGFHLGSDRVAWMVSSIIGSALATLVLWGRRSCPWSALVGGVLVCVGIYIFKGLDLTLGTCWLLSFVTSIPYAAVLLYGTRLLTPEERGRCAT